MVFSYEVLRLFWVCMFKVVMIIGIIFLVFS